MLTYLICDRISNNHQFVIQQRHQYEDQRRHEFEIQRSELEIAVREISQSFFENSRTTTTISEQPQNRQDQIMILKNDLSQMAKSVSNPVYRYLCQKMMDEVLRQIDDKLKAENFTEASNFNVPHPGKSNLEASNSNGPNPGKSDLEASDSNVPNPGKSNVEASNSNVPNPGKSNVEDSNFTFSKKAPLRRSDQKIKTMTQKKTKMKNMFCTIHIASKTTIFESRYSNRDQYQYEKSITILPAWWLVKLGISYAFRNSFFHSTISGWKHQFNPCRLVSSNALIFEFCHDNNLAGVQALLSRGEASVKDIDIRGRTPLHVSHQI